MRRSGVGTEQRRWRRSVALAGSAALTLGLVGVLTTLTSAVDRGLAAGESSEMYWPMNEGSGASVMVEANGQLNGTIGSRVDTGVRFDGATGYLFPPVAKPLAEQPPDPERLVRADGGGKNDGPLDPNLGDFEIEFRYRTTASYGNILQKGQNGNRGGYYKFEQPKGKVKCLFKDSNGLQRAIGPSAETPPANDGQWHTIRCVLSRSGGQYGFGYIHLYQDGVRVGKKALDQPFADISNDVGLSIGGKPNCNQTQVPKSEEITCDYFEGMVDYVKITKGGGGPAATTTTTTTTSTTTTTTTTSTSTTTTLPPTVTTGPTTSVVSKPPPARTEIDPATVDAVAERGRRYTP